MESQKSDLWILAEVVSCSFLQRNGYVIIERNYRCPYGEIDVIAVKDQEIIFIEVKSRSRNMQTTFSSVSIRKRLKIIRSATTYIMENPQYDQHCMRFDVIGLIYHKKEQLFEIKHLEDAFRVDELEEYL